MRNPVATLCKSSVGQWPCFKIPFGATADETEAYAARRVEYTKRLTDGIDAMLGVGETRRRLVIHSARIILGELERDTRGGEPELSNVLSRIRHRAEPEVVSTKKRMCGRCVHDGGCKRFLDDSHPMPAQVAVIGPDNNQDGRVPLREHLCATHFAEWIFKQWHEAWKNQTPLRSNDGKPMVFEPTPPPSLCERPVFDQDTLRFIEKRLDWVSEHEEGSAA